MCNNNRDVRVECTILIKQAAQIVVWLQGYCFCVTQRVGQMLNFIKERVSRVKVL